MAKRMSISGVSGYDVTTKDDLPSPPDPDYEYGSLTQGVKDLETSPKREISAKHVYQDLKKCIEDFAAQSPGSKALAAELRVELYQAAFPRGALTKGSSIHGTVTYGVKEFLELQEQLISLVKEESPDLKATAMRERVKLFKAAFPTGIYPPPRERSRSLLA